MTHSPQLGDVQSPCCPCVSSRSRSQLKFKYLTNKYYTLCRVRSITPLLMEGFPSNLNDTFTSKRGCTELILPMCQLKVKVTVNCQIFNKQILHIMSCPLYNSFTNGRISFKLEWHIHLKEGMCRANVVHVSAQGQGYSLRSNIFKKTNIRHSITPLLMEGFPSNLHDTFTSTRGCA